jgi:hypothetical protein
VTTRHLVKRLTKIVQVAVDERVRGFAHP